MPVENATPNRGYQLPDRANNLADDVERIKAAFGAIDVDVAGLLVSVAQRALLVHSHVIADTTGLQAALDAKQDESERGNANGYASLGADGKVPAAQLPATLFGSLNYQGDWNANTNTPTIPAAAAGNKGWYYMVSVAGATSVGGITDWKVGDWAVSDGTKWVKIDNTDAVASVAGLTGAITAAALKTALSLDLVNNTADSAKPVSTAQATAIAAKADKAITVAGAGLASGGGDLSANRTITVTKSTNAQAVAGTDDTTAMTPARVKDAILALGGGGGDKQIFLSSGTYTKPAGLVKVVVTVVGAGGGGGGTNQSGGTNPSNGGSGGGGGMSVKTILAAALGATETVTVGAGGAGQVGTGSAGGTSSFGAHCSATGGSGGVGVSGTPTQTTLSGDPGVGSGGDINVSAPKMFWPLGSGNSNSTPGGTGPTGLGGGGIRTNSGNGSDALANTGAGGSPGFRTGGSGSNPGGAGGSGFVIVEEYF